MASVTDAAVQPLGKRERILRAAVDVFAQTGFFNAKVSEVAKAAGVADGTIYLYFHGKEDLLITIFREHTQNFLLQAREAIASADSARVKLRTIVHHHLHALGEDRALAVVFQVELRHSLKFMTLFSQNEFADYLEVVRNVVEQGQASGEFRTDFQPRLVAKAVFGMLDEMVTSWILSDKDYRLDEHADILTELVLHGLAGR